MIHVHLHDADWKEDEHPREKGGEFTSGGGSTGGKAEGSETEEKKDYIGTQAHMQELADSVMKQYGLHPVRVEMNDLGADHAIGVSGGRTHINLNSKFFTPENMAKYAKEWDGLTVGADKDDPQKTAAGIILHEFGHVAMRQIQGESPEGTRRNKKVKEYDARWQEIEDLAREHWDRQHNGKGQGSPVSAYGQDNPAEFAAEAFVAQHLGTGAGWTAENRASGLPNAKAFWEALIAKGVPAKAQHSWDAAWKEEEHNRGGDPANPGRFSKGGGAGMHPPKAEAPKPASAPTKPPKLTHPAEIPQAKRDAYYTAIEEPPLNEGLRAAEDNWRGGLANFGEAEAGEQIRAMSGYFDYRSHLEAAAREHLGDEFTMYRSMSRAKYDAWKNGDDLSPVGATLSYSLATKWSGLAATKAAGRDPSDAVVVKIPVTPEAIVMRGHEGEQEIVIDPNEIDARGLEIIEPSKPASAPSPASEAPARKPDGISVKMHKDLVTLASVTRASSRTRLPRVARTTPTRWCATSMPMATPSRSSVARTRRRFGGSLSSLASTIRPLVTARAVGRMIWLGEII